MVERPTPKTANWSESSPDNFMRFRKPSTHRGVDAFIRHYYGWVIPKTESLIHMTDWGLYNPSEMIAITGLRESRGEERWLIDAPGHLLAREEIELGISLFSLSASFEWSSYLYTSSNQSTLYNWEGEFFSFSTDSMDAFEEMERQIKLFDLVEIKSKSP